MRKVSDGIACGVMLRNVVQHSVKYSLIAQKGKQVSLDNRGKIRSNLFTLVGLHKQSRDFFA